MSDYKNGQQLTAEEETDNQSSAKIKLTRIVKPLKLG